ncbi:MAG: hypothetical protein NTZ10_04300 [Candidatus Saganbacteria bacterium]|nr:hypothetical protein [Candidatus Saganbacteria bacterium]
MNIRAEYLVDEKGEKKSVVLSVRNYMRLIEYMEDLEDSADLKRAKGSARGFIDFDTLIKKLKSKGRIR